jgi:hypothetical protein
MGGSMLGHEIIKDCLTITGAASKVMGVDLEDVLY